MTGAAQAGSDRSRPGQEDDDGTGTSLLFLGWEITRTAKFIERALTVGVERHRVSPVAVRTLISVRFHDGGPLLLQGLAEEAGVTRANASAELVRLEAGGLISRSPDPGDGRRIRAQLTPSGHRQLSRWIMLGRNAVDDALAVLGPGQRRLLRDLTGRLGDDARTPAISAQRFRQVQGLFPEFDLSPLETGLALGRTEATMRARVDQRVSESGMTARQVHALILVGQIDGGSLQFSSLSPLLGVNHASVGRTLRDLEDRDLLVRNQDDGDRRRIRADLTAEGRRQSERLMPVLRDCYESALSPLSLPERTELLLILRRIGPPGQGETLLGEDRARADRPAHR